MDALLSLYACASLILLIEYSNLKELKCSKDFSYIVNQKWMFSFTGLSEKDVEKLKKDYSIYIVNSGRVNIAGITTNNVQYIAESINKVTSY